MFWTFVGPRVDKTAVSAVLSSRHLEVAALLSPGRSCRGGAIGTYDRLPSGAACYQGWMNVVLNPFGTLQNGPGCIRELRG